MATSQVERDLPALGAHARGETGRMLQSTLVELIALSLIGKQLHWSLYEHPYARLSTTEATARLGPPGTRHPQVTVRYPRRAVVPAQSHAMP
jgi:hypothetical protein